MDKRSSPKGTPRARATTGKVSPTSRSSKSGRFLSAAPVRTKAGSDRLVATLKNLGADPKVVEAAQGS
jgi:hypothetical protein